MDKIRFSFNKKEYIYNVNSFSNNDNKLYITLSFGGDGLLNWIKNNHLDSAKKIIVDLIHESDSESKKYEDCELVNVEFNMDSSTISIVARHK